MIRLFDIIFSLIGLFLLLPLFLIISVIIKIESKGHVFYLQNRVGIKGKIFRLIKFRSMVVGSDKKSLITIGVSDSRITKVGKFIRRFKIDELPQLINVLIGEMSIVGPRPEVEKYVKLYTNDQRKVLSIRPGITDYASIKFKDENKLLSQVFDPEYYYVNYLIPEKIKLSLVYVNNLTIRNYFRIILRTIFEVLYS